MGRAFWAAFYNKFCTLPSLGQVKYIFEQLGHQGKIENAKIADQSMTLLITVPPWENYLFEDDHTARTSILLIFKSGASKISTICLFDTNCCFS